LFLRWASAHADAKRSGGQAHESNLLPALCVVSD
jgi:hypothetical protein